MVRTTNNSTRMDAFNKDSSFLFLGGSEFLALSIWASENKSDRNSIFQETIAMTFCLHAAAVVVLWLKKPERLNIESKKLPEEEFHFSLRI